jgi:hypothetical protein
MNCSCVTEDAIQSVRHRGIVQLRIIIRVQNRMMYLIVISLGDYKKTVRCFVISDVVDVLVKLEILQA